MNQILFHWAFISNIVHLRPENQVHLKEFPLRGFPGDQKNLPLPRNYLENLPK